MQLAFSFPFSFLAFSKPVPSLPYAHLDKCYGNELVPIVPNAVLVAARPLPSACRSLFYQDPTKAMSMIVTQSGR